MLVGIPEKILTGHYPVRLERLNLEAVCLLMIDPSLIPPAMVCPPSVFDRVLGMAMNWKIASPGFSPNKVLTVELGREMIYLTPSLSIRETEAGYGLLESMKTPEASTPGKLNSISLMACPSKILNKKHLTARTLASKRLPSMPYLVYSSRLGWSKGLMAKVAERKSSKTV